MDNKTKSTINSLLTRIKRGEREAAEILHGIVSPRLRYIALGYLKSDEKANELLNEFWVNLQKNLATYIYEKNGYSYICLILKSMAEKKLKKEAKEKKYIDYTECESYVDLSQKDLILKLDIESALASLEAKEKQIIQYVYFLDLTEREIGKMLSMPYSTVHKIKTRALAKMKKHLKDYL